MNNTTINGALLKEMFLTGAALLEKNKAYVDSLNVFPVPDGDTGTNMSMTMQSAVNKSLQRRKYGRRGSRGSIFGRAQGSEGKQRRYTFTDIPRLCKGAEGL